MPAAILARFVLLEARRGGLPWLAGASIAVALGLASFLSQVAVTESLALQASIVAALLRASAVFLIAAHVASSTLRELDDKELERMLSLPLSRSTQYLGRLAGFAGSRSPRLARLRCCSGRAPARWRYGHCRSPARLHWSPRRHFFSP